jgi:kelch-like protein 20
MPRGGRGASAAPRNNVRGTAPARPSSQWATSAPLNQARAGHGGAECGGAIFVLGGWPDITFSRALTEVEYLGQIGGPWQDGPPLNEGRGNPAAAALNDRLYAIGGYPAGPGALTSVEVLDCGTGTAWSPVADLPDRKGRGAGAAAATQDRIYVTGGDDGTGARSLDSLLAYDPGTNQWQTMAPMPTRRSNLKMVYLNPYIYAIGGIGAGPHDPPLNTVERYDPRNNTWTTVAPMSTGRVNVGTAVVGNQILVVGGGGGQDFAGLKPLQTSEIYSPDAGAGTWTMFAPLLDPGRASLTSAAAGNMVLAIGGAFSTAHGFVTTREVDLASWPTGGQDE